VSRPELSPVVSPAVKFSALPRHIELVVVVMSTLVISCLALLVAVGALCRAVTDHFTYRRRVQELQRKTLEAQRSLKQRGLLANEIAHEIKNPITAILCSAETLDLLVGPKLSEDHRRSLRYIREYGDNLLRLVSDFLDLSRAEAGHMHARPEGVPIVPAVESIIGLLESNAIKRKVKVTCKALDRDIRGYVDPKHLKQILFNLIHNAIKFTSESGQVHVVVESSFPERFVRIEVRDDGPGISQELLPSIFNPYADRAASQTKHEEGTGLGLALCKALVEVSGGNIIAESKPGVGSIFSFTLPLFEEATTEEQATISSGDKAAADPQPLQGQTFLIVDEDTGSRESIARLIQAWGGMVDKVALAADAVEALQHRNYDAVMVDDTADGIYGYELARIIRDETKSSKTTIIVATRNAVDPQLAKISGADRCIEKPLNGKVLLHSLVNSGKYFVTH
jgi:signal transduction histidine kinase